VSATSEERNEVLADEGGVKSDSTTKADI